MRLMPKLYLPETDSTSKKKSLFIELIEKQYIRRFTGDESEQETTDYKVVPRVLPRRRRPVPVR